MHSASSAVGGNGEVGLRGHTSPPLLVREMDLRRARKPTALPTACEGVRDVRDVRGVRVYGRGEG